MRKLSYLLLVPFLLSACQQKSNKANSSEEAAAVEHAGASADSETNTAQFEFESESFDFGVVEDGEKVTHAYKFKNVGSSSLTITNAIASCGCTVPEWTREPVPPGETGEIKAVFDSKGRVGKHSKTITIYANTNPSEVKLTLSGEVKAKN